MFFGTFWEYHTWSSAYHPLIINKLSYILCYSEEIVKHINDTNASYRPLGAGDAKNTDLFLDNEHYQLFEGAGEHITVRYHKENLAKAILFIASILPRKFDQSSVHCIVPYSKDFVINQLALLDALFVEDGKQVNTITQIWNARKDVPQKNGKIDTRFYFNGLLKDVLYMDSTGKEQKGKFTIRNYFAGGYSELHIRKAEDNIFDVRIENTSEYHDDGKEERYEEAYVALKNNLSLQQIYYGAPGTGKSYEIDMITKEYDTIRTTFHPDSDYSTFVGAYKPMMEEVDVQIVPVSVTGGITLDTNKGTYKEKRITYKFVKQAFLKAYLAAWKKYAEGSKESVAPQFLVIEEINRGNCAQIFGDLFQLLDRQYNGFSSYPIEADADLQREIAEAFAEEDGEYQLPEGALELDGVVKNYNGDLASDIRSGRILLLPSNLNIWATMNTSDQSLFPIDSAFKRRWDWNFIKIADAKKGWMIKCGSEACDWWKFVQEINKVIGIETNSDDKKLGYFFCKPNGGEIAISEDKFVGKVLFYLWNDVFKDGDISMFKVTENSGESSFEDFYTTNEKGTTIVDNSALRRFLVNVVGEEEIISDFEDEGEATTIQKGKPRFSLDGGEPKMMLEVVRDLVKRYADNHAEDTAEGVVANINEGCQSKLKEITGGFIVETEESHIERCKDKKEKPVIVDLGNRGIIYVNRYWNGKSRKSFIEIAADKGWGNIKQEN